MRHARFDPQLGEKPREIKPEKWTLNQRVLGSSPSGAHQTVSENNSLYGNWNGANGCCFDVSKMSVNASVPTCSNYDEITWRL